MTSSDSRLVQADPIHMIVGVGASAGGLVALKALLAALPEQTGMTFLVVQHLAPDYPSLLPELLRGTSALEVREAKGGAALEPDVVYVISPNTELAVRDGKLAVSRRPREGVITLPIDHLLCSLADGFGSSAAGVLLTGGGHDGTEGLRAIRVAGGLTIAQDPVTAEHSGMPRSAIDAGVVDVVKAIDEIPAVLARYRNLTPLERQARPTEGDDEEPELLERVTLRSIAALLDSHFGFDITAYKAATIERRVSRRISLGGFDGGEAYLDELEREPLERSALLQDLMISVTSFFRNADAFESLNQLVVEPLVAESDGRRPIRVWVPGCATGEESYSIGMLFLDALAARGEIPRLQIFATDVDVKALAIARRGQYPALSLEGLDERRLRTYFRLDDNLCEVQSQLRDIISFARHDLTRDPPFSRLDLISCRNVLIYLRPDAQTQVLGAFYFGLATEGSLFLGGSESTGAANTPFRTLSKPHRIYQKDPSVERAPTAPRAFGAPTAQPTPPRRRRRPLGDDLRACVLDAAPPSIVVDEVGTILYAHGDLGRFLTFPTGEPQRPALDSVRPALATRVRSTVFQCRRLQEPVRVEVSLGDGLEPGRARINASPATRMGNGHVVVSFELIEHESGPTDLASPRDESMVEELDRELTQTRLDLKSTVEELESANEELRSANEESSTINEELQSANEELEASTEELRSLNEELTTVNAQLREKVGQLEHARDDLHNFLVSTRVPTIFLDESLALAQLTPATEAAIGLTRTHVGWYVGDIARAGLGDSLVEEARVVLDDLRPRSREVRLDNGRQMERRVLPYLTRERRVAGVVVTWFDLTEIRRTAEALERSEERLRLASQAARFGTFEIDPASGVRTWTDGLKQLFGLRLDAIVPDDPASSNFLERDVQQRVRARLAQSTESEADAFVEDEYRIRRTDGQERWVAMRAQTYFESDGEGKRRPTRTLGTVMDITERKRIEEELAESEARLRRLFDQAPALIAVHEGPDHVYVYSNPLHDQMTGGRELVGRPLRSAMSELAGQDVLERFDEVFRGAEPHATESFRVTLDRGLGHDLGYFTQVLQPWFDGKGAVSGVMSFAFDVTREVELRQAIEQSEARLQLAKQATGLGVYDFDPQSGANIWDERMHEVWGIPTGEMVTYERFMKSLHPDDQASTQQAVDQALNPKGDGHYRATYRILHGTDGSIRWIRATGKVLFNHEEPVRLTGMVEDVTDRVEAERELNAGREALNESARLKDEFIALLGHELRNPLAAIGNATELLGSLLDDESLAFPVQVLRRQTSHIKKLLHGLLDLSRVTHGKLEIRRVHFDVAFMLRQEFRADAEMWLDAEVNLHWNLPTEPIYLEGDPGRLHQVVDNLLSNAVKHTPSGGDIWVRVERRDDRCEIEIRDNGRGIEPELIPHIFDPFRQGHDINRPSQGLGLGLSLVRKIVEMHDGAVMVESDGLDLGATFRVELPVLVGPARVLAESKPSRLPNGLQFLLVEDNEDAAEMMAIILAKRGYRVEVASDATIALEMLEASTPDVVLCDLNLPGSMSGIDLVRVIRQQEKWRDVPILAVTGYGDASTRAAALDSGFDAHLAKPVALPELLYAVQNILAKHSVVD